MCNVRYGSYRQKCVGLGYSAPCRQIYGVFCVWDIRRSLYQPSKLHRPPLYGLPCSTTFSLRKIKITRQFPAGKSREWAVRFAPWQKNYESWSKGWIPRWEFGLLATFQSLNGVSQSTYARDIDLWNLFFWSFHLVSFMSMKKSTQATQIERGREGEGARV